MNAAPQRVRLEFLIALTAVVVLFGASRVLRTYRRERERADYEQTERQLAEYTSRILREERERLRHFAAGERGVIRRDAAALLMQLRRLLELADGSPPGGGTQRARAFEHIRTNFQRLREGKPAEFPSGQPFLRAYFSTLDASLNPYGVCVPTDYDGARALPLILELSDRSRASLAQFPLPPHYGGAIAATVQAPLQDAVGRRRVLDMLGELGATYPVQPGRVFLVAEGRAAAGALGLAARRPHRFAGVLAVSPRIPATLADEGPGGPLEAVQRFLAHAESVDAWAANLQRCRIVMVQEAGAEPAVVERVRALAQRLSERGVDLEYLEFPLAEGRQFPVWVREYALASLLGRPAGQAPQQVAFRTAHVRHNRAWWVEVGVLGEPFRFGSIQAEVADGVARVEAQNVEQFSLLLDRMPAAVSTVETEGIRFSLAEATDGRLTLSRRNGTWAMGRGDGLVKRRGVSGPVSDVLCEPFVVVYGTVGDDSLLKEICRAEARRFADDWERRYGSRPRLRADSELSDDELTGYNLLLLGGPQVNSVTLQMAADLPLQADGQGVRLGKRSYRGPTVGAIFCYPHPLDSERMVAVVAGASPAALYQAYQRFGWGECADVKWWDYAVFDSRSSAAASFLEVGMFDSHWQPDGPTAWRVAPVRGALLPQRFPMLGSAAESSGRRVALEDVRPESIEHPCGAVEFNRAPDGGPPILGGRAVERAIVVRAPSALDYGLDGAFSTFEARVGLHGGGETAGEVIFELRADGQTLYRSAPMGGPETGREQEIAIRQDVSGRRRLSLRVAEVSPARQDAPVCIWAEPVLIR